MSNDPISIPEIIKSLLTSRLAAAYPSGLPVVVGPALDAEQQSTGVVSITEAGAQNAELYAPIAHQRIQLRCIHARLATAEQIARNVYVVMHQQSRQVVTQASNGHTYLVHQTNVIAGPSAHFDTEETWEYLMFVSVMVGTQAIS
jgi:shikimate 5-dehydrogenase